MVFATRCSAAFLAKYACIKRTLNAIYCFPYTHGQQVEERRKKKKKEKREEEEDKEENKKKNDGKKRNFLVVVVLLVGLVVFLHFNRVCRSSPT